MNRPVIFLDFDGVLNTERYQALLAIDDKPTKDLWGPLFDPAAVSSLRLLLNEIDARIVVSSSWRCVFRIGTLRLMWETRELPGEIDDVLQHETSFISRGEEIESWLERNGRPDYVIIDDLDDFLDYQRPRYVETSPIIGLTPAHARKAIHILSKYKQ